MRAATIHIGCSMLVGSMLVGSMLPAPSGAREPAPRDLPAAAPAAPDLPGLVDPDALERSGMHKDRVGTALLGLGADVALIGTGVLIAGLAGDGSCARYQRFYDDGYLGYRSGRDEWCEKPALTAAGAAALVVGLGMIVPGIVLKAGGADELEAAQQLRLCGRLSLSLRPMIARDGAGLTIAIAP